MARYTIVRGDTLDAIARAHGTTYQALAARNSIVDPNVIRAGDTIDVPPYGYAAPPVTMEDTSFGMDSGLKWKLIGGIAALGALALYLRRKTPRNRTIKVQRAGKEYSFV